MSSSDTHYFSEAALYGESESKSESTEEELGIETHQTRVEQTPVPEEPEFTWLKAIHLIPGYERLIHRNPPIAPTERAPWGRVIAAAYLEDTVRKIRRNCMFGGEQLMAKLTKEVHIQVPPTAA